MTWCTLRLENTLSPKTGERYFVDIYICMCRVLNKTVVLVVLFVYCNQPVVYIISEYRTHGTNKVSIDVYEISLASLWESVFRGLQHLCIKTSNLFPQKFLDNNYKVHFEWIFKLCMEGGRMYLHTNVLLLKINLEFSLEYIFTTL